MLFDLAGLHHRKCSPPHLGLEVTPTAAAAEGKEQQPAAAEAEAPRGDYDRRKEPELAVGE